MAVKEVQLSKEVYGKITYPKIVNTEFSELVVVEETPLAIPDQITVAEFFAEYDRLFFQIPRNGANGSHEELVKRSSSYIGVTGQSDEIQALLDEINDLRIQLLTAQQEIVNLSTTV
ncbi:hypothetical protein OAA23_00900 [bacterium]|jgi:hypothetical protein|nr:hypothetical protein [bacterium]|tara:strand:+ start:345 stop:695 length:351 start_codon:yes stop_codon:yes gene_type:complete